MRDTEVAKGMSPKIKAMPALLIAGLKLRTNGPEELPTLWQRFSRYFGEIPTQVGSEAFGVIYNFSAAGFDYLAGVRVSSLNDVSSELAHIDIPAQRYATFAHEGHVRNLSRTIDAIWKNWQPAWGRPAGAHVQTIERYGEHFDPQAGSGDIEVWIPIEN